jgi:hypothetical protein
MLAELLQPGGALAIAVVASGVCVVQACRPAVRPEAPAPIRVTGQQRPSVEAACAGRESELRELALGSLVWPASVCVPLLLSPAAVYTRLFPAPLRDDRGSFTAGEITLRPPLGLALGIGAVVVGQLATVAYHWARRNQLLGKTGTFPFTTRFLILKW